MKGPATCLARYYLVNTYRTTLGAGKTQQQIIVRDGCHRWAVATLLWLYTRSLYSYGSALSEEIAVQGSKDDRSTPLPILYGLQLFDCKCYVLRVNFVHFYLHLLWPCQSAI